jgi:hypothetical protein
MHKSATKCNETVGKWCKNKHGASDYKNVQNFENVQILKNVQISEYIQISKIIQVLKNSQISNFLVLLEISGKKTDKSNEETGPRI